MDRKIYCFDIDGTICTNTWGKYEQSEPMVDRIIQVNKLFDEGHYIIYMTCLLYTSPSPRDGLLSRMPSSA